MSGIDPNRSGVLVVGGGGASLSDATPQPTGTAAAGVSTSAARADHVHAASVAAADISDAGATGIALVQASTAAAARSVAGAAADATVTADAMAGTGWTITQSAPDATAAWGSSKLSIATAAGYNTLGAGIGAHKTFSDSPSSHDVLSRVDFTAGDTEPKLNATLWSGVDSSNALVLVCYADGLINVGHLVSGSWTALRTGATGPTSGQRTGGQLWLRLSRRGAVWAAYWGVGTSDAVPTSWTLVWSAALADATTRALHGGYVRCAADTEAGVVLAGGVDVLAIRRSVPAESL